MSRCPYFYSNRPHPLSPFDSFFRIPPEFLYSRAVKPNYGDYHNLKRALSRSTSQIQSNEKKFQLCLDVHQFAPEEILVKTVGRQIIVEGKHEEKEDEHGMIYRHFVRKYTLPDGCEPNDVVSNVSSDGVLTITAPHEPITLTDKNERIVPIIQTGPVHYAVKDHKVVHESGKKHPSHRHHPKKEDEVMLAIKFI